MHIEQPYWYEWRRTQPEEYGLKAARALEAKILEAGLKKRRCLYWRADSGALAVIILPSTYWPEIQRLPRARYFADQRRSDFGFGRGRWFGCDFGFAPDLMPKGLSSGYQPIGGVMVGDRVAQVLMNSGDFNHGMTYSGHPVAAAVAAANLKILRDEGIVDRVRDDTGPYRQKMAKRC